MSDKALESARRTLAIEADGLAQLADGLTGEFAQAVDLLAAAKGRVIISGMGKSGHIGTKMAASFASTGTPAQFVHPAEASHGDLGMITENDVILALSWSGGTAELANLVNYASRFDIALIAMTSNPDSLLARASRVCLTLPKAAEACPMGWRRPHPLLCKWRWVMRWPSPFWSSAISPQPIFAISIPAASWVLG